MKYEHGILHESFEHGNINSHQKKVSYLRRNIKY